MRNENGRQQKDVRAYLEENIVFINLYIALISLR